MTKQSFLHIRLRRDTAQNWTSNNPILKIGEPGLETDTRRLKFGDGISTWNNLQYSTVDFGSLTENIDDRVAALVKPGSNINITYNDINNELTIAATGLQPSGNYATLVNGRVSSSELPSYVDDVLEFASLSVLPLTGEVDKIYVTIDSNKIYRWSGSTYIEISASPGSTDAIIEGSVNKYYTDIRASGAAPVQSVSGRTGNIILSKADITNFDISVSGLLPGVTGTGYVISSFTNNIYSIGVTGVQPSGNYSVIGHNHNINDVSGLQIALDSKQPSGVYASGVHTHTSSDITDFTGSISGLLPVTNILGGSNIGVTQSGSIYTVAVTGSLGLTTEEVDDRVSNLLVAGTGISLNYNDNSNSLTIDTSGLQHSHPIKAYIIGGMITLYNTSTSTFNRALPITYFWGLSTSDIKEYSITNYPTSVITVDCINSVNKALADYPNTYVHYSSLEVVLLDSDNRAVGWAISSTDPSTMPTHGLTGYSLTMNLFDFPNWSTLPTTWNLTRTTPNTNSAIALFNRPVAYNTINLLSSTSVLDKGAVSGTTTIDGNSNIQTMSMNGTSVTFTLGNNWYGSKDYSRDVVLKIIVSSPTSIVWSIVNEWYNQPPAGALSSGTHIFLLRFVNQSLIECHYIGNKTN